jgi:type I restriction enzyme S subunit
MKQSWPTVSLGELLRLERRKVKVEPEKLYQEIGIYCFGRGIFHKTPRTGFEVGEKDLFLMKQGDFILQVTFAWEGAIAVVSAAEDGMYGSTRYPTFRVDESRCVPQFLLNYFATDQGRQQLVKICPGSAGRNRVLSIKRIPEVLVLLPSLAEQRRVVARIEELAAQIHEARTLRKQATREAEALLTTARRAAIEESKAKSVSLEDACAEIIDNLHSNPRLSETGIPCIRSPDVGFGTLNLNGAQRTDEDEFRRRTVRGEPRENDIVFVREGGGTGKCAVVRQGQRFSLGQRVMMLRPNTEIVLPRFFLHQLLAPQIQGDQIAPLSKGSASPHLNIATLRRFNLILPPLPEQRRIVAELDALQAEVDALLPAVLDRAFKGEL